MKFKSLACILVPVALTLTGCQERYRYPCQDPENWGEKTCQRPFCSANGTCPDDLTHYEKSNAPNGTKIPESTQRSNFNKGDCNKC
jgi:endogenous inhibitor of DNA gyrase (YacG/DUF329 family)